MFNKTTENIMSNYIPHETYLQLQRFFLDKQKYQATNFE